MGVITLALVTGRDRSRLRTRRCGSSSLRGTAIALGTYLGGWRIIRTMGKGLTELRPQQGFAAQTGAATVILASSHLGFSLSTTQVCSGAVMGAGVGRKGGAVRWSTATRMFIAWGLTLPAAAAVGARCGVPDRARPLGRQRRRGPAGRCLRHHLVAVPPQAGRPATASIPDRPAESAASCPPSRRSPRRRPD